jgi:serine/threonine protein kinase
MTTTRCPEAGSLSAAQPATEAIGEDDPRIIEALEEYAAALEAGQALDRDAFLTRHHAVADVLRRCIDGLELVHRAAPQLDALNEDAGAMAPVGLAPTTVLDDYQLIRELGHGGMGVVYEAEQLSLGRRVALKVLPFASALDPRQRQRFLNEAHAAAALRHRHIVPIFAIGCARGVHFYTMQLIEGRPLTDVLQAIRRTRFDDSGEGQSSPWAASTPQDAGAPTVDSRTPEPSGEVAPGPNRLSLLERVADSLSYFREVARIGEQAAEALEYAHQCGVVHRDVKLANLLLDDLGDVWLTDFGLARCDDQAGLTSSGDLVGTLRYMSPEQAQGGRLPLDQRTDIYSLGASLYELLTLEPLFAGRDRSELLHRVMHEEPRRPRSYNRAVPRDLETIVQKALAKEPKARYLSAADVAADLRRFLDGRPVLARPIGLIGRAQRWASRHQSMVAATAAVLLLAVLMLGTSTVLMLRQRDEIERRRQETRRAIDTVYTQVAQRWLAREPHLEPLRRDFLQKALEFYEREAANNPTDIQSRYEAAKAQRLVGDIQYQLGRHDEAGTAYARAVAQLEQVTAAAPMTPTFREELGLAWNNRGTLWRDRGEGGQALHAYEKSRALYRALAVEYPDVPQYRDDLGGNAINLGILLMSQGRFQEAEGLFRHARGLFAQLALSSPEPAYRRDLAVSEHNLGHALAAIKRQVEADNVYRQALAAWDALVREFPDMPGYRREQALARTSLGALLAAQNQFDRADGFYREALVIEDKLAADYPATPTYRQDLAAALHLHAGLLSDKGDLAQAEQAYRRALALRKALVETSPSVGGLEKELADTRARLADLLRRSGRTEEADVLDRDSKPKGAG